MVLVFTPLARLVSRKREKASSADSLATMEIIAFFLMLVTPLGSCEIYQKPSAAAKTGKTPETLRDSSVFSLVGRSVGIRIIVFPSSSHKCIIVSVLSVYFMVIHILLPICYLCLKGKNKGKLFADTPSA